MAKVITKTRRRKARAKPQPDVGRGRKIVTRKALPILNVVLATGAAVGFLVAWMA